MKRSLQSRICNSVAYRLKRRVEKLRLASIPDELKRRAALSAAPKAQANHPAVHTLIRSADLPMLYMAARSLALACESPFRWYIHDDGSLSDSDEEQILATLPGATVIRRDKADAKAESMLEAYPQLKAWRSQLVWALKLVDPALWSQEKRIAYIDSDILFLRRPDKLLSAMQPDAVESVFNRDFDSAYTHDAMKISSALGVQLLSRINAGMWVMDSNRFNFETIEQWLSHRMFDHCRLTGDMEQTLTALVGCNGPVEYLPTDYDLGRESLISDMTCRHYAGILRQYYAVEGLDYLFNSVGFSERWSKFVAANSSASGLTQ